MPPPECESRNIKFTTHQNRPVAPKMDPISQKQPPRRRQSSAAQPPPFQNPKAAGRSGFTPAGPWAILSGVVAIGQWPPRHGVVSVFQLSSPRRPSAPLSPTENHSSPSSPMAASGTGVCAREIRWPFPGRRSAVWPAQPLNGCGRGGRGGRSKNPSPSSSFPCFGFLLFVLRVCCR